MFNLFIFIKVFKYILVYFLLDKIYLGIYKIFKENIILFIII